MILIRLLLPLLILFAALESLSAQREKVIQTDFTCIALSSDIKNLKILSSDEVKTLDIYTTTRSKKINYRGLQQLTFFRESETLGPDGQPVRTPVGQVKLNGSQKRYLLLFAKSSSNKENYSIYPIPDIQEKFKAGTYRFLNLAPFKLAVKIGESQHFLAKKNITDVNGDFEHGNYYQTIILSLPEGKEEPVPIYSGRIYFNQNTRMLYIILPKEEGKTGKIKIVGIPERVTPNNP